MQYLGLFFLQFFFTIFFFQFNQISQIFIYRNHSISVEELAVHISKDHAPLRVFQIELNGAARDKRAAPYLERKRVTALWIAMPMDVHS